MIDKEFKNLVMDNLIQISNKIDLIHELVIRHDEQIKNINRVVKIIIGVGVSIFLISLGLIFK